jgi:glucosamine--fructose-6-phosphate aminotransferase (isomerizing)
MCGICGFIGYENCYQYLINGLIQLQNRGYDSAGICLIDDKSYLLKKYATTQEMTAVNILANDENKYYFNNSDATIGIAHTRWATHGAKTDNNSHPHICYNNRFSLVHNGIIENYVEIKEKLLSHGVTFNSQTDSEVIVNLISYNYTHVHDTVAAINLSLKQLEGTWGLVILNLDTPDKIYCIRHGSPLLIGLGDDFCIISSEQSGFSKYVNNYICINNNDLIVLEKHNNQIRFEKNITQNYDLLQVNRQNNELSPDPYKYWTLKEINEQPDSVMRALGMGGRIKDDYNVKLGGLSKITEELTDIENLIILGCGTSYHAGLHVLPTFKRLCGLNTVQIFDGAEFNEYDIPKSHMDKTAIILLSQSGETRDLYQGLEIAKNKNLLTIGIINVVDSQIAKDVTCGVYLNAGREVGVASTKAFTSQVVILNLVAVFISQIKNINKYTRKEILGNIRILPVNIREILDNIRDSCIRVAKYLKDQKSVFILGKNSAEAIAKEGALKIKEIGYIHAEGYNSSALKHGPYSLIEVGTPVIILCFEDDYFKKNLSIIEEVKSRNAYVIVITDNIRTDKADIIIRIPRNNKFSELLSIIPMQLIAYELSILKGHDPDFPRNLAKTITTH